MVKILPANAGNPRDAGLIPGSGRSPGGRNGNPLQYSCLENPMDRGGWRATVHGATRSQTWLSDFARMHTSLFGMIHSNQCLVSPTGSVRRCISLRLSYRQYLFKTLHQTRRKCWVFYLFFLRKKFLPEVHTGRPAGPQQSKQEGKPLNLTLWVP